MDFLGRFLVVVWLLGVAGASIDRGTHDMAVGLPREGIARPFMFSIAIVIGLLFGIPLLGKEPSGSKVEFLNYMTRYVLPSLSYLFMLQVFGFWIMLLVTVIQLVLIIVVPLLRQKHRAR